MDKFSPIILDSRCEFNLGLNGLAFPLPPLPDKLLHCIHVMLVYLLPPSKNLPVHSEQWNHWKKV